MFEDGVDRRSPGACQGSFAPVAAIGDDQPAFSQRCEGTSDAGRVNPETIRDLAHGVAFIRRDCDENLEMGAPDRLLALGSAHVRDVVDPLAGEDTTGRRNEVDKVPGVAV